MGEIAEMMINGSMCTCCGEYLGENNSSPTLCDGCADADEDDDLLGFMTEEVTCPWCGCEQSDSFEFPDSRIETCYECKKKYRYDREIEVTYSSVKIPEEALEKIKAK